LDFHSASSLKQQSRIVKYSLSYLLQDKPEDTQVVKEKKEKNSCRIQSKNSSDKDKIYTVNKYVVNQRLQRVYDISFRELILFSHFVFRYIVSHDLLLL
jgi:hypothetical protein